MSAVSPHLKRGDVVEMTFDGRTVEAYVALASPNGQSLMLMFYAMVGGYAGAMPVLWRDGAFYDLVRHERVEMKPLTPKRPP